MRIEFPGRTVVVLGAARGIGSAIVAEFLAAGAAVWACDIAAAALDALDPRVERRAVDVTDESAVAAFIRAAEARTGAVDVLVHVAGGVRGKPRQPIEDVSTRDWLDIYEANVMGAVNAVRAAVPGMKRAKSGRIVIIASPAGMNVSLTGIQSYASAKAAQLGLMRQLAHELGQFGIGVNAVAPGFMPTSPDYERQWAGYGEAGQKALIERNPMRRLGRPEEIAYAVMFLASPYAGFINGQVLPVTGGPTV
ncbi:MAG: SDR family oxidoreductase [Alphaproteobacteria bacterium]|nr:SDR family oxidoreductase [Alphaproteobacteria bacterium]